MLRVEESVEINRPVEEVFDYVSNVENIPVWAGPPIEVHKDDGPGPVKEGDRFSYTAKFLGRRYETPFEVTSHEPNRRLSYRGTGGPISSQEWTHTFEETPTGTTRYTQVVEGEPGGFLQAGWTAAGSSDQSAVQGRPGYAQGLAGGRVGLEGVSQ